MKHNFGKDAVNAKWFPTLISLTSAAIMPLAGILERRTIFKVPLLLSALFCSLGILLSHLSVKSGHAYFTLTYCLMYGIGYGLNFPITPSVVIEWFPNHQCLACGSVFFGLGVGTIFFSQLQTYIVKPQKCNFKLVLGILLSHLSVKSGHAYFTLTYCLMYGIGYGLNFPITPSVVIENYEFDHGGEYTNGEIALHSDITIASTVNPRNLIRNRAFVILWLIQLFECFPTTTLFSEYKTIGTVTMQSSVYIQLTRESSTAFLLVGFILWSFLADKISYKIPLLSVMLIWTICLASAPQCLKFPQVKFFYASLVFISALCIAGCRVLLYIATARAFGVKYLSINFPCVYTASIFGRIASSFYTIYYPIFKRPDLILYICASLNAAAFILGIFLPDKDNKCCQSKVQALQESSDIELSKNFPDE
nr:oxalate:formate antiporter [Hymenolepis microstoma]